MATEPCSNKGLWGVTVQGSFEAINNGSFEGTLNRFQSGRSQGARFGLQLFKA